MTAERSVLHVLPHPGGGGETYVDLLRAMDGYSFERVYLASRPDPRGARGEVGARVVRAHRAARSHDVVHVAGEVASALMLPTLAARPSVVTTHGLNLLRRTTGVWRLGARAALAAVVGAASRTICTSQPECDEIVAATGARARSRLVVVPNGVPLGEPISPAERAQARASLRLDASDVVAAWVGSLDELKDPLTPIEAARAVREDGMPLVLLIAGDGPLRAVVDKAATRRDGAVRVLGFRADVRSVLSAADFYVVSSAREGLAFSLLDAMALGLPVAASDIPGNVAALDGSAVYARFGDVAGFSNAFRVYVSDERERARRGAEARARVEHQYRVDQMVERTRQVYDAVIAGRRRRRSA